MLTAIAKTRGRYSESALATAYAQANRDPVLAQFEMIKRATNTNDAYICRESGISRSCLRNWRRDGKTKRPQHITLVFAFRAMGYRFALERV